MLLLEPPERLPVFPERGLEDDDFDLGEWKEVPPPGLGREEPFLLVPLLG
ncbi:MAG: hypothetical protein R6V40_01325 [Candidatus Moraniibacteriota bacterium]